MDTEEAQTILYDIQSGTPAAKSRLTYTKEHKAFRAEVEAEWETYQKEHPDAVLDVPAEMSSEPVKAPAKVEEREFSSEQRNKMAKAGSAMKDGSFPIANAGDLANAVQAIGRAKNPAAAKAHIKKRAAALGLTNSLPESWRTGVSESEEYGLTEADWMALAASGHPVPLQEFSGGHFFGAWKGGKASSGGGPEGGADGNPLTSKAEEKAAGATHGVNGVAKLPPMFKDLHGKVQPAPKNSEAARLIAISRSPGIRFVSATREAAPLTEADWMALRAAGHPVPAEVEEKSSTDHFYGAWRGGKASSGGGPDANGDGKVDAKADGGKADYPFGAGAPGNPVHGQHGAVQPAFRGKKWDRTTRKWWEPGPNDVGGFM